jgi:hypothetical protein
LLDRKVVELDSQHSTSCERMLSWFIWRLLPQCFAELKLSTSETIRCHQPTPQCRNRNAGPLHLSGVRVSIAWEMEADFPSQINNGTIGDNVLVEMLASPGVTCFAWAANPAVNTLAYSSTVPRCRNEHPISRNTAMLQPLTLRMHASECNTI